MERAKVFVIKISNAKLESLKEYHETKYDDEAIRASFRHYSYDDSEDLQIMQIGEVM